MRILIIEDDNNKMQRIAQEVQQIRGDTELVEARSYQSGMARLMTNQFDFLLLDMSLPTFDISPDEDGFQVDAYAGRSILAEMNRKNIRVPTVVISMFETFGDGAELMTLDELDKELKLKHSSIYKGAVYYNSSETSWKEQMRRLIGEKK